MEKIFSFQEFRKWCKLHNTYQVADKRKRPATVHCCGISDAGCTEGNCPAWAEARAIKVEPMKRSEKASKKRNAAVGIAGAETMTARR